MIIASTGLRKRDHRMLIKNKVEQVSDKSKVCEKFLFLTKEKVTQRLRKKGYCPVAAFSVQKLKCQYERKAGRREEMLLEAEDLFFCMLLADSPLP